MFVDWRGLFGYLRIEWIDRGRNTSRGNVNIACPWCRDDPSFHLGVSESKEAYFCFRQPNRHSGRNFISLLMAMGQSRSEAMRLINYYSRTSQPEPDLRKREDDYGKLKRAWDRFAPASDSQRCLTYLAQRGFPTPRQTCEQFDLRMSRVGEWANRLLFPLQKNGEITTWVGRAIDEQLQPKYRMQEVTGGGLIYAPDFRKPDPDTLVIVEGPVDALKVASACHRLPIIAAALNGKHISAGKLLRFRELSQVCSKVLVALDSDVATSTAYQTIAEISQAITHGKIARVRLPLGYKDPGEIPCDVLVQWLHGVRASLT